ncbi:hypothetical protein T08_11623 [Trichinella sp. T8]|nr:hypothetical protein T08_11623 [Trichinella sp. T8]
MTDPLLATIHCPKPTLLSEILLCLCCDTPAHPKSTMCLQLNSGRLIFQWFTRFFYDNVDKNIQVKLCVCCMIFFSNLTSCQNQFLQNDSYDKGKSLVSGTIILGWIKKIFDCVCILWGLFRVIGSTSMVVRPNCLSAWAIRACGRLARLKRLLTVDVREEEEGVSENRTCESHMLYMRTLHASKQAFLYL